MNRTFLEDQTPVPLYNPTLRISNEEIADTETQRTAISMLDISKNHICNLLYNFEGIDEFVKETLKVLDRSDQDVEAESRSSTQIREARQ